MAVLTRQQLIDYCLRDLGAPVLEINVDDEQVEDRIDQAIEFFNLYHYEGIERVYLKHKIVPSKLNIIETNAALFSKSIIGLSSGAKAIIVPNEVDNTIRVKGVVGEFIASEQVSDGINIATLLDTNFYIAGDTENKYIDVPDAVFGVSRVLPFNGATQGRSSDGLFNVQYQLRLNDLYDLSSTSIIYYKTVMSHLALLDLELNGHPVYRFNRMSGKLYLDVDWLNEIYVDDYIVVEAYRALDPTEFTKVYNEPWLKKYATALIKRQWGTNLKKFSGLALPGGVTLDGNGIFNEATQEIDILEKELMTKSAPLDFFLG